MFKKLWDNEHADVRMVGAVVGILITLIIAVLIFYTIAGNVDTDSADDSIQENVYGQNATERASSTITPASNGTDDTLDQAATFFQIAPIIAIVVVAVVILGYVSRIG